MIPCRLLLFLSLIIATNAAAQEFDQAHPSYAKVLTKCVSNGQVDYAGLKAAPQDLDAYLNELTAVRPEVFASWSKDQRLALLLNLYNAWTLRLIIDHYPLKSIRDIGFLPLAAWRKQLVRFGGQIMTLDHLENKIIRAEYGEPRTHFALVCAAKGCPPLRAEPYVGEHLGTQLDDQTKQFLAAKEKNRFEAETDTLWLSPIFKWYQSDFTDAAETLEAYVRPFLPEPAGQELARSSKVRVRFTDYDWSLNDAP